MSLPALIHCIQDIVRVLQSVRDLRAAQSLAIHNRLVLALVNAIRSAFAGREVLEVRWSRRFVTRERSPSSHTKERSRLNPNTTTDQLVNRRKTTPDARPPRCEARGVNISKAAKDAHLPNVSKTGAHPPSRHVGVLHPANVMKIDLMLE
jgi:hypothetical protein